MKALLDTNILIDFLNGIEQARDELARYDDPAISIITRMEVMVGASAAGTESTRAFLSQFLTVGLDEAIADEAMELRRRHRLKLPSAIIWASARVQNRLLVTRNDRDFPPSDPGVRSPYRL